MNDKNLIQIRKLVSITRPGIVYTIGGRVIFCPPPIVRLVRTFGFGQPSREIRGKPQKEGTVMTVKDGMSLGFGILLVCIIGYALFGGVYLIFWLLRRKAK